MITGDSGWFAPSNILFSGKKKTRTQRAALGPIMAPDVVEPMADLPSMAPLVGEPLSPWGLPAAAAATNCGGCWLLAVAWLLWLLTDLLILRAQIDRRP